MIANLAGELASNFWSTVGWLFLFLFVAVNTVLIAVLVTAWIQDWLDGRRDERIRREGIDLYWDTKRERKP